MSRLFTTQRTQSHTCQHRYQTLQLLHFSLTHTFNVSDGFLFTITKCTPIRWWQRQRRCDEDIFYKCNSLDDSQQCMFVWIYLKCSHVIMNQSKWGGGVGLSKSDVTFLSILTVKSSALSTFLSFAPHFHICSPSMDTRNVHKSHVYRLAINTLALNSKSAT